MLDEDAPQRVAVQDEELLEEWVRKTREPSVRGVGATRMRGTSEWPWRVTVWAAEFVREEPLEQRMRDAIDEALRAVPGVADVAEEDREAWIVAGDPSGEALIRAAAAAVDGLQGEIRRHVASLG